MFFEVFREANSYSYPKFCCGGRLVNVKVETNKTSLKEARRMPISKVDIRWRKQTLIKD
jgi:hypothetical protein